jgi:hypothetical protein
MPSPRPHRPISARGVVPAPRRPNPDGSEWRQGRKRTAAALPRRAAELVELMVLGDPDRPLDGPMSLEQAAARMGIKAKSTGRFYLNLPNARSYFNSLCEKLREGEVPRNLWAAIGIRDDQEMKKTAAGNRVRLEAIKSIEKRDGTGVNVSVNVGGAEIVPGYLVALPAAYAAGADEILRKAGSTRRMDADGRTIDITPNPRPARTPQPEPAEHHPAITAPVPRVADDGPTFGRRSDDPLPPADSRRRRVAEHWPEAQR